MGDYDWNDSQNVEIAADAMRDEAPKWSGFSNQMMSVLFDTKTRHLEVTAFSVIDAAAAPCAIDLKAAYDAMHQQLCALFEGGVIEFMNMSNALRVAADMYENNDRNVAGRMQGLW
jgi:uncharacterized protein YukE